MLPFFDICINRSIVFPQKAFQQMGETFFKTPDNFAKKYLKLSGKKNAQFNKFPRYKSKQRCPGCYRDINMKILLAMLRMPIRTVLVHEQGCRRGYTAEPQAFSAQAQGL